MQEVRLWEVISDRELHEIPSNEINLEERLEGWLESDISVLDPNLLVIGRQVRTASAGAIDLLCLDSAGHTVIVELKRGRTSREVAAQVLDYASWVKDLSHKRITGIAGEYFKKNSGSLESAFQERFEKRLPDVLNSEHRSLIVAESMDDTTARIVRYLSSMSVPINMATVHHFKDKADRSILAMGHLVEPEEAEAKSWPASRRTTQTVNGLQDMADANGIGELYAQMKNGVRGILSAQPYTNRVWYRIRRDDGGMRTVLIVDAEPHDENSIGVEV